MIDVFKIKQGDTIKFRNGDVHIVKNVVSVRGSFGPSPTRRVTLWVIEKNGRKGKFSYEDNGGRYRSDGGRSAWDIVEHVPAKEDKMIEVVYAVVRPSYDDKPTWVTVRKTVESARAAVEEKVALNPEDDGHILIVPCQLKD